MRVTTPLALVLALSALLLSACAAHPAQFNGASGSPSPSLSSRQTIRYLALGDSYTIGESVEESQRWPVQLSKQLKQRGIQVDLSIIARTGWTTDALWQGIQNSGVNPPYDLVSLLIGVNNQYRGYSIAEYREQFRFLLGKAIEYAGDDPAKVFVVSIPDWGVTPFAAPQDREKIATEVDAFNAVNREEAESAGIAYVDIAPYSRTAADDPELIAPDGLHPSGKMYVGWVERILPVVLKAPGLKK
jgi:lysophospholipase L1-like esterase